MKRTIQFVAGLAITATAAVAEVAPGDVVFGDYGEVVESLTGVAGDPEAGRAVMNKGSGNCVACHQVTELLEVFPFHGEVGPSLDYVGERWTEADLRGILVNAKNVFPDTMMPAFYKVDGFNRLGDGFTGKALEGPASPLLTAQQIEDVIAYLMTLQ
ncbi:sulfur oxidation c-type cytochrome SoxX [Pelagovum sp. HNIBRBA483]|uniref:sulfur oxidation c-type cytochrome SoxX n=1 Tax=Pelagovum sp. HNIBRBA483 TaxID=3233341 RepID=UPI0034A4D9A3